MNPPLSEDSSSISHSSCIEVGRAGLPTRANRRILFVSHNCYFDTSNGASIASRAMMECLARQGFAASALTGMVLDSGYNFDPGTCDAASWLAERALPFEADPGPLLSTWPADAADSKASMGACYRLGVEDVAVVLDGRTTMRRHEPDEAEIEGFLGLLDETIRRFQPDVMVNFGGNALANRVRRLARSRGIAVVFALHNFNYTRPEPFTDADAVIVPSRFAASYYRRFLGLQCDVLPNLIDFERVQAADRDPRYVTFVNPSYEKGVYVFAMIADELGQRRPDIPLLVVEGRGTERTLVDCGIDLRVHGNVSIMNHTPDPRQFWRVTRICIMPSLWWENQPLVAIEAMVNGIPVIGSDRGGMPEALGDGGIVLRLPSRLTPSTRDLPTAADIEPWVKAIIGLWDDPTWYAEASRRSLIEARRWDSIVLEPMYAEFFDAACIRDGQSGPFASRLRESVESPRRSPRQSRPVAVPSLNGASRNGLEGTLRPRR